MEYKIKKKKKINLFLEYYIKVRPIKISKSFLHYQTGFKTNFSFRKRLAIPVFKYYIWKIIKIHLSFEITLVSGNKKLFGLTIYYNIKIYLIFIYTHLIE